MAWLRLAQLTYFLTSPYRRWVGEGWETWAATTLRCCTLTLGVDGGTYLRALPYLP